MPLADVLARINDLRKGVAVRKQGEATIVAMGAARARSMKPRVYQAEDILWLRDKKRGILGWAPGLGKTLGGCEAVELPAVVTCPLALVEQWREFLQEQYPKEKVSVAAYGNAIRRDAAINREWDWLIINHDAWRTYWVKHPSRQIKTVIADEMHHFRNREAERSKKFFNFAQVVERVYGLTATPVFKDIGDLWHLLHILDPKAFTSYWQFINTYAVVDSQGYGNKIVRIRDKRALESMIGKYIKERTYKQVGMYLPERIDKHVVIKMDDRLMRAYKELRDHYRLEIEGQDEAKRFLNAGAVLHELRKFTVTPQKINAIKEIVDDTPGDLPIVVFCWYKDTAERVAAAFGDDGVFVHGEIKPQDRRTTMVTGGPKGARVRVATMESVSEGIDVSMARTVIYAEETYVPGQKYQSMTRIIRYSKQENPDPVIVYWVRHQNTVDEVVHNKANDRTAGNALTVLREALLD